METGENKRSSTIEDNQETQVERLEEKVGQEKKSGAAANVTGAAAGAATWTGVRLW